MDKLQLRRNLLFKEMKHLQLLFCQIESFLMEKESVIIAIDGCSAAGKTTLASLLMEVYNCNVFHMDSFFLRPHQRTVERLAEPGGNVDYERFGTEVLQALLDGKVFSYRPYNCQTKELSTPVTIQPKQLNIIEGVYSMHHALSHVYDFSVFMRIDNKTQEKRILIRNGPEMQKQLLNKWISLGHLYFEAMKPAEYCDLVLNAEEIQILK